MSLYIRKKLKLQVEVGRARGGESLKGSRHVQRKRKKKAKRKINKKLVFIPHFYSSNEIAIFERQNNIFILESYSYVLIKRAKSLFNIFLCKRGVLIGVVLVSYN